MRYESILTVIEAEQWIGQPLSELPEWLTKRGVVKTSDNILRVGYKGSMNPSDNDALVYINCFVWLNKENRICTMKAQRFHCVWAPMRNLYLEKALEAAVGLLALNELGHSQAVSEEFVALFSILARKTDPEVLDVLNKSLEKLKTVGHKHPVMEI